MVKRSLPAKARSGSAPRRAAVPPSTFAPSDFPADGALSELYAELLALPNVHGCYVGRKTVAGRRARQLAVVCCVQQKVRKRGLVRSERVPLRLKWPRTRSRHFVLETDVQEAAPASFQTVPVVGPGDELQASGAARSERATVGIALRHPVLGRVVTTAGHAFLGSASGVRVFGPAAPMVTVSNAGLGASASTFNALPLKAVRLPEADYALLQPQSESRNLFRDALNVSGVHFARPDDVEQRLFALTKRGAIPTVLRGVNGTLDIGNVRMRALLFTDDATQPGDSGCCLVDASFRAWGLLVGVAMIDGVVLSVFASCNWLLALEHAELT